MATMWLPLPMVLIASWIWQGLGSDLCLDNGIEQNLRQYIQDDQGNNIPIGLLEVAWQSSELLTEMTSTLIREVLGYHTTIAPDIGANGASPIYALAGCLDFDNNDIAAKQCGENETLIHVSVDSWVGSYASAQNKFEEENPTIAALDLGSMGYAGEESMYVSKAVLDTAYAHSGLALDFYKSYNTSHFNPLQYFDTLSAVNISELQWCNATDFSNGQRMYDYARFSGDWDGVERQGPSNSTVFFAKCPDGKWWHAPQCRGNAPNCIPVFTAGNGWKLQAMMQWTAAYEFPAAIAIPNNWGTFVKHVQTYKCLHYWWIPDSTFISMLPEQLVFPRHSALEWLAGDKKTGGQGSYVSKMVSSNLQSKAARVQDFVSKISFELQEVQELLLEVQQTGSIQNVSCRWIRENTERWTGWKPVETNCYAGFGMIDASGSFLPNRTGAVGCGLCPAGTASEEVLDNVGRTFQCKLCPPGYSQANTYSTTCEPCPKGSSTTGYGSIQCTPCDVGQYQPAIASTTCLTCNSSRTTLLLGASSPEDCVCPSKKIETPEKICVECSAGLNCPVGSTVAKLQAVLDTSDERQPFVEIGFFGNPSAPLDIYKCVDTYFCPGGSPGTCFSSLQGLTCGECADGYYWAANDCQSCGVGVPLAWAVCLTALAISIMLSYYTLTSSYTAKASVLMCTTASLGMLMALFQNLGVLNTVDVPWPPGLKELLQFSSIFTLNLDALGFSCAAGGNLGRYGSTAVSFWVVIIALPCFGMLTNVIPICKRRRISWEKNKTLSTMGQFLQVGFTTMCNVGLMPFMCHRHPTGEQSIPKYSNVFCGSTEHAWMQALGALVLFLSVNFFMFACFAAYQAPRWSGQPRLAAIRFLIFRFRPSVWWFGLVLLARGPLLSLPGVVATNMPSLRLTLMLGILLASGGLQLWFLPWKAPILNLIDAMSISLLVMLLAVSLGYIDNSSQEAINVLQVLGTLISSCMVGILTFMVLLGVSALVYRSALGSQKELRVFNLGRIPSEDKVFGALMDIATWMKEDAVGKEDKLMKDLRALSVYDLGAVTRALDILADDLEMAVSHSMRSTSSSRRIAAGKRTSRQSTGSLPCRGTKDSELAAPEAPEAPEASKAEEQNDTLTETV